MKHSRPGFATRYSDRAPSKLNADMVPALHRKHVEAMISPLDLDTRGAQAAAANPTQPTPPIHSDLPMASDIARMAQQFPPPDILVNPNPTEPPKVLEPGK